MVGTLFELADGGYKDAMTDKIWYPEEIVIRLRERVVGLECKLVVELERKVEEMREEIDDLESRIKEDEFDECGGLDI